MSRGPGPKGAPERETKKKKRKWRIEKKKKRKEQEEKKREDETFQIPGLGPHIYSILSTWQKIPKSTDIGNHHTIFEI